MPLSPEQFKEIIKEVIKDEIEPLRNEIRGLKNDMIGAVDSLAKKHEDHDAEHVANLGAHDRMQGEIDECRVKLGLRVSTVVKARK